MQNDLSTKTEAASTTSAKPAKAAKPVKAKAAKPEASPVAAKAEKPAKPQPFAHAITRTYAGPSPVIRNKPTKTAINTAIGAGSYTHRDDTFARDMLATYGTKPFPRGNADAGCIRRAIAHNLLAANGDGTFAFTTKAAAFAKANKPLASGLSLPASSLAEALARA